MNDKNNEGRRGTPRDAPRSAYRGISLLATSAPLASVSHRSWKLGLYCHRARLRLHHCTMPLPINFSAVLSELLAQFLFVFICAAPAS
jgi:hypothetical protein